MNRSSWSWTSTQGTLFLQLFTPFHSHIGKSLRFETVRGWECSGKHLKWKSRTGNHQNHNNSSLRSFWGIMRIMGNITVGKYHLIHYYCNTSGTDNTLIFHINIFCNTVIWYCAGTVFELTKQNSKTYHQFILLLNHYLSKCTHTHRSRYIPRVNIYSIYHFVICNLDYVFTLHQFQVKVIWCLIQFLHLDALAKPWYCIM